MNVNWLAKHRVNRWSMEAGVMSAALWGFNEVVNGDNPVNTFLLYLSGLFLMAWVVNHCREDRASDRPA